MREGTCPQLPITVVYSEQVSVVDSLYITLHSNHMTSHDIPLFW